MEGLSTMEAIGMLRSGATPQAAWWEAFGASVGADGAPALDSLAGHEATALQAAGRLAHRTGAPLADILERVEECARARRSAEAAREVALAGPRASARVLLLLPAVGWVFAVALDPRAARILVASPFGWGLLALGAGLWFAGRAWLGRLVDRAEVAGSDAAPAALLLALAEGAISCGLDVRGAVREVGSAVGGQTGSALEAVAERLASGASWTRSWGEPLNALAPLERALRSAWLRGASPAPTLAAARAAVVEGGRSAAERAAGELGVRATLPLALCLLPCFVVVGVLPLVAALAMGFGASG